MRGVFLTILASMFAVNAAARQPLCAVEELARVGGEFSAVSGEGDIALVSAGTRLLVVDVSNSAQPTTIGAITIPGGVGFHSIAGRRALVMAGDELRVYDLADPRNPTQIGAVTPRPGRGLLDRPAIDGDTAYLLYLGTQTEVVSIDITNPANPTVLSSVATGAAVWFPYISAADGVVTVSVPQQGFNAVWFIDASEPATLRSAATVGAANSGDLATNGAYTYHFNRQHIDIYDSSDPYRPQVVGRITLWAWFSGEVELAGNRLFAIIGHDPGGGSIVAFDISTPTQPVSLGSIRTSDQAWRLAASGDRALVLFDSALNVTGGNPLSVLGSLASDGSEFSTAMHDGRLYVTSTSGLHVYDVSDPHQPVKTGEALVYSRSASGSASMATNGHMVYFGRRSELRIYDASSGAPVLLATAAVPCSTMWDADGPVVISGCGSSNDAVVIVDLTDPNNPRFSRSCHYRITPAPRRSTTESRLWPLRTCTCST